MGNRVFFPLEGSLTTVRLVGSRVFFPLEGSLTTARLVGSRVYSQLDRQLANTQACGQQSIFTIRQAASQHSVLWVAWYLYSQRGSQTIISLMGSMVSLQFNNRHKARQQQSYGQQSLYSQTGSQTTEVLWVAESTRKQYRQIASALSAVSHTSIKASILILLSIIFSLKCSRNKIVKVWT